MIHPGIYMWSAAIGIALLSFNLSSGFDKRLAVKYSGVKKTVESAQTFRQRLDNLRHVNTKFEEVFPAAEENIDLYSLYGLTGVSEAGAEAEPAKLLITRLTAAKGNEQLLGATEYMLSMSGVGYSVLAEDIASALEIADKMLSKPYVEADQVTFKISPGSRQTRITFTNYTVTMRDPPVSAVKGST